MKPLNENKSAYLFGNKPGIPAFKTGLISLLFIIISCKASLAPKFDQDIVDNLATVTTNIFQLIATVAGGSSSTSFEKREDQYNTLIGTLEGLELQIGARPFPKSKLAAKVTAKANQQMQKRGISTTINAAEIAPSATALKQIRTTLSTMKDADKQNGLKPMEVAAFGNSIRLLLDQALTYERHLNK